MSFFFFEMEFGTGEKGRRKRRKAEQKLGLPAGALMPTGAGNPGGMNAQSSKVGATGGGGGGGGGGSYKKDNSELRRLAESGDLVGACAFLRNLVQYQMPVEDTSAAMLLSAAVKRGSIDTIRELLGGMQIMGTTLSPAAFLIGVGSLSQLFGRDELMITNLVAAIFGTDVQVQPSVLIPFAPILLATTVLCRNRRC